MVVVSARWFILVCGLAVVALTFVLARRLFGARAGLIAAGLLAIDPIHFAYSQIVRTDIHETVFRWLRALVLVNLVRRGRVANYIWAAVRLGLACGMKWSAVTVFSAIVSASVYRMFLDSVSARITFVSLRWDLRRLQHFSSRPLPDPLLRNRACSNRLHMRPNFAPVACCYARA